MSCNGGENSLMESCACCPAAEEADAALTRVCASKQPRPPSSASQTSAYSPARRASVRLSDLAGLPLPRQICLTSCDARAPMAAAFFVESSGL